MEVKRVLRMAEGTGETSYASNSSVQKAGSLQLKHLIDEAILDLYFEGFNDGIISIADLGCSSGPNTLWIVSEIINVIHSRRRLLGRKSSPQYLIYLNDLESNDFNTVFKTLLPPLYEKLRRENGEEFGPCFVAAMPGSFYGRLFPNNSLNFVHSSYSLHWLSQVPTGLEDETGNPINKGNAYLGKTSPPRAFEAYLKQFQKDFSNFLKSRAEEIVGGGKMVLIFLGRGNGSKENFYAWTPLTIALHNTISQGFIEESEVDSFNLPAYHPSIEELRDVIAKEGSFHLNKLESREFEFVFDGKGDGCETDKAKSELLVKFVRAFAEPILAAHFGEYVDKIFENCGNIPLKYWEEDQKKLLHVGISLTRKKHDALA